MKANLNHVAMLVPLAAIVSLLSAFPSSLRAASVDAAEDLAAVIALQGKPCGKVVGYKKLADNDFVARCATGDVYRVYVDARGRVHVDKQG